MWIYEPVSSGDDYLAHHGILGMKWGVRRYQNKDGTLTTEGRRRSQVYGKNFLEKTPNPPVYGKNPLSAPVKKSSKKKKISDMTDDELIRDNRRHALEAQYKKNHPEKKSKLQSSKEAIDSGRQLTNQMKNLNQVVKNTRKRKSTINLSEMTDDDLRRLINRKNLEQQYRNITYEPDKIDKGQAMVDEILDYGGAALAITSSALSIALAIRELKKG